MGTVAWRAEGHPCFNLYLVLNQSLFQVSVHFDIPVSCCLTHALSSGPTSPMAALTEAQSVVWCPVWSDCHWRGTGTQELKHVRRAKQVPVALSRIPCVSFMTPGRAELRVELVWHIHGAVREGRNLACMRDWLPDA